MSVCGGPVAASVLEYDLGNDWSDAVNPFGRWMLLKNDQVLTRGDILTDGAYN